MAILSAKVDDGRAIKRNLHALALMFPDYLEQANQATAADMVAEAQRNIRENDSIASGDLFNSIESQISPDGLTVAVGSTSKYAPFVEFGTRPHMPPVSAILRWCRLKGIPDKAAWPIALKIKERGTPEQPFLYPAAKTAGARHIARVKAFLQAGIARVVSTRER